MGANNNLHQILRSLCFNTHWNYAIFWKLKHRARMILTWEDAYYDPPHDHDCSESKHCRTSLEQIDGGKFSHDPLGLAVAKMSYRVYLKGEGIVGQFDDGWQSQFSAGIRTIVVVPVVPLGVVQLGSLNKVIEDMGIVTHIREIFLYSQDYIIGHIRSQMQNSLQSSSSLHVVSSDIRPACFHGTEKIMTSETLDVLLPINNYSLHSAKEKMDTNLTKHGGSEFYSDESSVLLQSISNMKHQECGEMRSMRGRKYEGGSSGCKDMKLELDKNTRPILHNTDRFNDSITAWEKVTIDSASFPSDAKPMDVINSSQLTYECRPEHLLEAMVANFLHSNNDVNSSGVSFCTSMNQDASIHQVRANNPNGCSISESCLIREDKNNCFSSSSVEPSAEPAKNSKRRGRVGESCRPRPRDRQLIQDCIKELRELVPSGAKCSIDSLLERAIKHMLFLQSITKHADKLIIIADTKTMLESSSYEQGSSWVMEVRGHLKVHSILVENLSKNGHLLVEMLCEDSKSHFLDIAKAIRSLDLTMLKRSTRSHGEKIWISFVVESQHNRNVHILDILWPLVQILQAKASQNNGRIVQNSVGRHLEFLEWGGG
ncbi:hypothetical protein PIB30_011683 [Stylosanthes scabra]|uniref:BHLH domain-containing protein n=1 Tax=Stylosanthes scabra TaxID=79078 RepID=A0ABU6X4Z7_9FABA|nr:hypothetical protein [Stylosanthes scabra]